MKPHRRQKPAGKSEHRAGFAAHAAAAVLLLAGCSDDGGATDCGGEPCPAGSACLDGRICVDEDIDVAAATAREAAEPLAPIDWPCLDVEPLADGSLRPCDGDADDCEEGMFCPLALEVPVDRCLAFCSVDADCAEGTVCVNHDQGVPVCIPPTCAKLADCSFGLVPRDDGLGLPCAGDSCPGDDSVFCHDPLAPFLASRCLKTCVTHADCGDGWACLAQQGTKDTCVPLACYL